MRQKNAATDADFLGMCADRSSKDGRLTRDNSGNIVMFTQPIAVISEFLGVLRKRNHRRKRVGSRLVRPDQADIKEDNFTLSIAWNHQLSGAN